MRLDHELSEAIISYLGYGVSAWPGHHRDRLVQRLGTLRARELQLRLEAIFAHLAAIQVDWTANDLASAGRVARDAMRARHPELSEDALHALEWKFTFDSR